MMARHMMLLLLGAVVISAGAETVSIAPENGVRTNVTARIVGSVDVAVNPGTGGGGIVRLNPANGYTGTTTLGCGTLLVDSLAPAGGNSSVGSDGRIEIAGGTFRYAGPDGMLTDRMFTNCPASTSAAIYDISNELYIAGSLIKTRGSFVKTGPGTLHLCGTGTNTFSGGGLSDSEAGVQARFVPTANGDAPAKGYRHFHVLEGTLVLGEQGGTTLIEPANDIGVGGWTTDDGQEVEGVLEVRGGYVKWNKWFMHGSYNGKDSNTSVRRPRSTVRVLGGILSGGSQTGVGGTFAMGRNKLGSSKFPQNTEPHLEVFGGRFLASELSLSDDAGANSVVQIRDTGVVQVTRAYAGRVSGGTGTTVTLEVSNGGTLLSDEIENRKTSVLNLVVTNGGIMVCNMFKGTSGSFNVLLDDATVTARGSGEYALFYANLESVKVGRGGVTLGASKINRLRHAMDCASEDEPGAKGVTIANTSSTGVVEFCTPNTYHGPTAVTCGYLSFQGRAASRRAVRSA